MIRPEVIVTVDGVPVSGAFFERLISLTITDREGIQADQLELTFTDGFPHFQSPRRGAVVNVNFVAGLVSAFAGSFVVNQVEFACLPYRITVRAHSADLRSDMKTNRTRYWDNATVRKIVEDIAAGYDLETRIADEVSDHEYEWIGQQDESDLHFLERLARRHSALFTIKNGTVLWLARGTGQSADGTTLAPAVLLRTDLIEGTCRMSEGDIDRYATVKAYWQDRKEARRQEVVVPADPEATGEHVLRDTYASKGEAEKAAQSHAREMLRGNVTANAAIEGRPTLMAGQPFQFAGVRPVVDGRAFIAETVTHSFSKSGGLRTQVAGKLKADA